jgi:ABC-2 type transporter
MGSMYAATMFMGMQNSQTVLPVVDTERTVFYREKAAGMYSALPYAMAQVKHKTFRVLILKLNIINIFHLLGKNILIGGNR